MKKRVLTSNWRKLQPYETAIDRTSLMVAGLDNKTEDVIVVNTETLFKTFSNQMSFIPINGVIRLYLIL
jgi:transcription termination factor NusB